MRSLTGRMNPALGAVEFLHTPKACILNSSQGMFPLASDSWTIATTSAVECAAREGWTLVTSVGVKTWDLVCYLAGSRRVPQIILVQRRREGFERHADVCRDFNLPPGLTCILPYDCPDRAWPSFRDEAAVDLSDRVFPVSVRKGGKLSALVQSEDRNAKIDSRFTVDWEKMDRVPRRTFDVDRIRREVDPNFENHLIHWTRSCDGPWPGEEPWKYYRDLLEGDPEPPRNARRTLDRILSEGLIRGSVWRIRSGEKVAAFSCLPPSEAVSIMRIRSGGGKHFFEPLGVALEVGAARAAGIRPVQYSEGRTRADLSAPRYLLQGTGKRNQWLKEREHRIQGDLDLSRLPRGSWRPIDLTAYTVK